MDYEYQTTFWADFSIAEPFGQTAIKDTAKRAFEEWKDNIVYLTELIMVLNHKCWYYANNNVELSILYEDLYYEYDELAYNYIKDHNQDDLTYYFKILD